MVRGGEEGGATKRWGGGREGAGRKAEGGAAGSGQGAQGVHGGKGQRAGGKLEDQKLYFLIGSPMRTAFCNWQDLNSLRGGADLFRRAQLRAMVHPRFVCELCNTQIDGGRCLLH